MIGNNVDSNIPLEGLTLDELNATSNRQARVTKKTQLARMLECIHGMRPEYAEKLANQFGTFRTDFHICHSILALNGIR